MFRPDIAFVDFTLQLWAKEGGVNENNCLDQASKLAGNNGSSHAAHRVTDQDRSIQLQLFDKADNIAGQIGLPVTCARGAGPAVAPSVG